MGRPKKPRQMHGKRKYGLIASLVKVVRIIQSSVCNS